MFFGLEDDDACKSSLYCVQRTGIVTTNRPRQALMCIQAVSFAAHCVHHAMVAPRWFLVRAFVGLFLSGCVYACPFPFA